MSSANDYSLARALPAKRSHEGITLVGKKEPTQTGGQEDKLDEMLKCAIPDCRVRAAEGEMFLMPFDALRRLNGGKRVPTAELGRFALCRNHNRQWRAENGGAQTMRLADAVRMSRNADARAAAARQERDERPVEARLMASLGAREQTPPRTETEERDERQPANRKPRRPRQSGPTVTKDGTRGAVAVGQGLAACAARDRAARLVVAVPEAATAAKARNGRAKPATATPAEAAL